MWWLDAAALPLGSFGQLIRPGNCSHAQIWVSVQRLVPFRSNKCVFHDATSSSLLKRARGGRKQPRDDFVPSLLCREFGRWKVSNLAVERRDFLESPLPLTPEFIRNIRVLGRRPSTQMITDNLIRKYGTHFLLSATLGGKQQ